MNSSENRPLDRSELPGQSAGEKGTPSADILRNEQMVKKMVKTGSLLDHYQICLSILNTPNIDTHLLAGLFVYMRLFTIKDMKLGMRHNYQVKDISHIQSELSMALTKVYINSFLNNDKDKSLDRVFIRNIMNFIPRGGGNGDELRLFILDVMRRHNIREGHRPGIDDPFIEEWHQKLHSCSTTEDITICEAYIAFQETNSLDLFYKTLWERAGISVEFLKNMAHPLTHAPRYMPQLIPDLKHLLWILKQIHAGSHNFHYLLEVSKWQLDKELFSMLEEIKNHFGAWWIPGKIIDCRHKLKHFLRGGCPRDPLMIDVSLDNMYKTSTEKIDLRNLNGDDIIEMIFLTLQNIHLSYDSEKIALCIDLWKFIKNASNGIKWSREWGLQAFAALSYIQSMIQAYTEELYEFLQPKAQILGESCNINESYTTIFAEEVIRSQNTFSLSKLIDALFPVLRKVANIGSWKIISHGRRHTTAIVKAADSLFSVQALRLEKLHIMVVEKIYGTEDIPSWVTAILTPSDVDILSHIAIRCRNSDVLLATCYERNLLEIIKSHEGNVLSVYIENDTLHYKEDTVEAPEIIVSRRKGKPSKAGGSKSHNLIKITDRVSNFIKIPPSITVPFEMYQQTLQSNRESLLLFNNLTLQLSSNPKNYSSILIRIRELINSLTVPADIVHAIQDKLMGQEGIISQWSESLEKEITFYVKKVWASVWNERAYLSRFSRYLDSNQIRMGVLIQKAIPARYSFIIHTHNPGSDNNDEIISEIVIGLGETLAGNSPGTPLCVVSKKRERTHSVLCYPSKNMALLNSEQGESLIVRSDSNDEDLSDFSGAGLYDSFFINKPIHTFIQYDKEALFWNKDFQFFMFDSILRIAEEVEGIMKCPQDIEGIYSDNSFYVVQTRNQIK
jgi:alpha-glucan,water dikinase